MKYLKQTWENYDYKKSFVDNMAVGGVVTRERLQHMEDGIAAANNERMNIVVIPGEEDISSVVETLSNNYLEVRTSHLEPKHKPLRVIISPAAIDSTEVVPDEKGRRLIRIGASMLEPKQPPMQITLRPAEENKTVIEDIIEPDKNYNRREVTVHSKFLNQLAFKVREKEVMVTIDDWVLNNGYYESILNLEDLVSSSNIVRITRGDDPTEDQLDAIHRCEISSKEEFDGTFKLIAKYRPSIDIPVHITII